MERALALFVTFNSVINWIVQVITRSNYRKRELTSLSEFFINMLYISKTVQDIMESINAILPVIDGINRLYYSIF